MRTLRVTILLLAAGCGAGDERYAKLWAGIEPVVRSPSKVEAFRVAGDPRIGDYSTLPVVGAPVAVDSATASEFAKILLDPGSYTPEAKPCIPSPGVKVRFTAGSRAIDVYFCFECVELFVYEGAASRGGHDFDPAQPRLAAIAKRLFPKDPAIQALK